MRMHGRNVADGHGGRGRPRLANRLPEHLLASHLSADEVGQRVEVLTGTRLDPRTLRRYLSGEPILDSSAVTLAAICRALDITIDAAVELVGEDALELQLADAGRRLLTDDAGAPPRGWGKPEAAWGDVVKPFIEERRGRY